MEGGTNIWYDRSNCGYANSALEMRTKMHHETVEMPASSLKTAILEVLKNEGFIVDFVTKSENNKSVTTVTLKYTANNERVIKGLKRISKPGLRVYAQADDFQLY